MDKLYLKNLRVFAHHGLLPEETAQGQIFVVSAALHLDTRAAGRADDVALTVDYAAVARHIKAFMEGHTYALLEAVAENLAESLLQAFPRLHQVTLNINKPQAPLGLPLDYAGIEITRSRGSDAGEE